MTRVRITTKKTIHPGWLGTPRTAAEMVAIALGVSTTELITSMQREVDTLVNRVLSARFEAEKNRYLTLTAEPSQQKETLSYPTDAKGSSDITNISHRETLGDRSVFLWAAEREGGYREFLAWYDTDNWGQDAWFELGQSLVPEDLLLRQWLDDAGNQNLDEGNELE